jgi:hypothetical protein
MRLQDYGAREDSASRYGAVRRSSLSEPTVQSLVGDAVDGAPYRHALVWVPERLPTMDARANPNGFRITGQCPRRSA